MTTNPLALLSRGGGGSDSPPPELQAYADDLNKRNFSRAYGWHWFVNQRRLEDGSTERYLDRQNVEIMRFNSLPKSQRFTVDPRP